jgi:predicted hydrocarbon binding protein
MEKVEFEYDPVRGEVFFRGAKSLLLQRNTYAFYHESIKKYMGPAVGTILYNASKRISKHKFFYQAARSKTSGKALLKKILDYMEVCALGKFDIIEFADDFAGIEVMNSCTAYGIKAEKPICSIMSGLLAGLFELITGRECYCEEVQCIAMGNKSCIFKIVVFEKKADPVRKGWPLVKSSKRNLKGELKRKPGSGELFFKGSSVMIVGRGEQAEFQREFESVVGPAYKTFMYEVVGKGTGKEGISQAQRFLIKALRFLSTRRIMEKLVQMAAERGMGVAELINLEKDGSLVVRVENSYNAEGYKKRNEPVCYVFSGVIAGGSGIVLGKKCDSVEKSCIAKGDPFCEFHISPKKK